MAKKNAEEYVPASRIIEMMKQQQGGKDQKEFATEIGISEQMLSSIYSGTRRPGQPVLEFLGKKVKCKIEKAEGIFRMEARA